MILLPDELIFEWISILKSNPSVEMANSKNLVHALSTALLMLPQKFTEEDLYTEIAWLSYLGIDLNSLF
jgi:translocator assembly and maintenance protein 41